MVLGARGAVGYVLGRGAGAAGNGLLTGLVAYWGLDEASGDAADKHSGGLTLTQTGSPGAASGVVYSTARTFNGSNQYFTRASDSSITLGDIDYAVAMWVFLSDLSTRYFIGKANALNGADWDYAGQYSPSLGLRWIIGNGTGNSAIAASTFGTASTNTWYLFIAQHVATTNTIFVSVNAGTEDSATYTGTHDTTTKPLAIGRLSDYSGNQWYGRIGPVAIWKNRTLDATARSALWNGGAGLAYSAFS